MKREKFKEFVEETLENVIKVAEEKCGQKLSRKINFRWFSQEETPISENIAEHITAKVFLNESQIYPCVDIGVGDILEDGTLIIFANIAGYKPTNFQKNWQGEAGPFIYIIGSPFLEKMGCPTSTS